LPDVPAAGAVCVHDRHKESSRPVQGVIKAYDPRSRTGVVVRETDRAELELASDALVGSIFRMLRQGQRVIFDLDGDGLATRIRIGSEIDMGAPAFATGTPPAEVDDLDGRS
jgi:CspA family cold shock protein